MSSEEHLEDRLRKRIEARRKARLRNRGPYRKAMLTLRQKASKEKSDSNAF